MFVSRQDVIIDLDPVTGATLNQFAAPAASPTAPTNAAGLAFNGQELFYVKSGVSTIFVLNPDTGAQIRSFSLPAGTVDGLAEIAGKLLCIGCAQQLDIGIQFIDRNASANLRYQRAQSQLPRCRLY